MPYTFGIWHAWAFLRKKLILVPFDNPIPQHWRIEDITPFLPGSKHIPPIQSILLLATLSRIGTKAMKNLWDPSTNRWIDFKEKIKRVKNTPSNIIDLEKSTIF